MKKPLQKILIAGGGTGGHLFSGIAVAERFKVLNPEGQVLFVGTPYGLEREIVPKAGFALELLPVSALKGKAWRSRLKSLFQLPYALAKARRLLKRFKPDLVLGIGGYASAPAVMAARLLKIPRAILEQNAYPGFTNRKLAGWANRIFVAFPKALEFFPKGKTYLTGNPLRQVLQTPEPEAARSRFCVFILGGSQGAHTLNQSATDALKFLQDLSSELHFIHQTGKQDFEQVQKYYSEQGFSAEVFPFSPEIQHYYAQTDLMICRAGAGTITELQLRGLPSLLVPYPHAADDHQRHNAADMVAAGAAELILNSDCNGESLAEKIRYYRSNPELRTKMSQAARSLARPDAAENILALCQELV